MTEPRPTYETAVTDNATDQTAGPHVLNERPAKKRRNPFRAR